MSPFYCFREFIGRELDATLHQFRQSIVVLGGHDDFEVPDAAGGQEPFFLRHDKREVVRVEKPFDGELHGKKYDERVKGIEGFNKPCIYAGSRAGLTFPDTFPTTWS